MRYEYLIGGADNNKAVLRRNVIPADLSRSMAYRGVPLADASGGALCRERLVFLESLRHLTQNR